MVRPFCSAKAFSANGILLVVVFSAATAQSADLLTVKVAEGRSYAGLVDHKTDERQLWLRLEEGTGTLRRPISWERITAATHRGQAVELRDLPTLARQIASSRIVTVQPKPLQPASPPPAPAPPPVASLAMEAALANWDADVETDGLAIWLRLLDEEGFETRAAGTLEVELLAPRIRKYHEAPQSRGYSVDLIERWSVQFAAEKFRGGQVLVRLPLGAIHPEFDRGVDALGLVHARLAVPGQGVFEQSVDGVSLRTFSPVRDALLDNTGRHFLPTEATGRGEGAYPLQRW